MAGGLVLGPVVFQAFEVPERIRFGGKQRLAVHALAGGGRVVDAMGAEEGPVSWSGVISGPGAEARVRMLEGLRRSGVALPLSWSGWLYTVMIESFEAETVHPAWVPYRLGACVLSTGQTMLDGVGSLVASVGEIAGLGGILGSAVEIADASARLGSGDPVVAMEAAGGLARMVAGNALAGVGVV